MSSLKDLWNFDDRGHENDVSRAPTWLRNAVKTFLLFTAGGAGATAAGVGPWAAGGAEGMGMGAAPGEAAGSFTGSAIPQGGGAPAWADYIPKQMPGGNQGGQQNPAQAELERLERERRDNEYKKQLAAVMVNVQNRGWNG